MAPKTKASPKAGATTPGDVAGRNGGAGKTKANDVIDPVPIKVPRLSEAPPVAEPQPSPPPPLPQLPNDEHALAAPVMAKLIPWVAHALGEYICKLPGDFPALPAEGICGAAPLAIDEDASRAATPGLKSFKPPWTARQCLSSMATTGMYEASGNVAWIKPFCDSEADQVIAGDPPTWAQVKEMAEANFALKASHSQIAWRGHELHRLIFPCTCYVFLKDKEFALDTLVFNYSLNLLTGHVYVFAWWWAVYEAVRSQHLSWIASLWQAGLTVTIHLRGVLDVRSLVQLSCVQSEVHKAAERMLSDSFPAFAMKALQIIGDTPDSGRLKSLNDLNIKYKNSQVNRSMLQAILLFEEKICCKGRAVLRDIERLAGRETLTAAYTKLLRLVMTAKTEADALGAPVAWATLEVLKAIRFELKFETIEAKHLTAEALGTSQSKPGYPSVYIARRVILDMLLQMIREMKESGMAKSVVEELDSVATHFKTLDAYEETFYPEKKGEALAATQGEGEEDTACPDPPGETDAVERLKSVCKHKVTHQFLDFAYDVFAGVFDVAIENAIFKTTAASVKWLEANGFDSLRDLMRGVNVHRSVVSAGSESAPPLAPRTLKPWGSNSEREDERNAEVLQRRAEVWQKAQALRKKHCGIGFTKGATKKDLQAFYERTPAFSFRGRPGEAHRVFLFSADLYRECRNASWVTLDEYTSAAAPIFEFMLTQLGPADIAIWFDGRSKSWRKQIEKATEDARNQAELWLIHQPSPRLGRKISFASEAREVALVSMPLPRTRLTCKVRTEFVCAGETSTHDTTYTGVEPMPWPAMPMVSIEDKAKIHGFEPPLPKPRFFDTTSGLPLFWQERKPISFWQALLKDMDAKCVFDLTPGSGACARAAMSLGISYTCLCRNAEHNSWLQNVLDRAATKTIVQEKSPMFDEELAKGVREHFQEVLDQLHRQDACKDLAPEGDDEEDQDQDQAV
jgi:hypothetical protein